MTKTEWKVKEFREANYSTGLFSSEMSWLLSVLRLPDMWKDSHQFKRIHDTCCLEKAKS